MRSVETDHVLLKMVLNCFTIRILVKRVKSQNIYIVEELSSIIQVKGIDILFPLNRTVEMLTL